MRMLRLYHEHYAGFAIPHFHEPTAGAGTAMEAGDTTTRLWLREKSSMVAAAPKRGAHRRKRPRRRPDGGDGMLHQDASKHAWLVGQPGARPGDHPRERTSAIYNRAFPVERGGHRLELFRGTGRGDRAPWPVRGALQPTRQATTSTRPKPAGRCCPRPSYTQVGRGASATRHRPHRRLLTARPGAAASRAFRTLQDRLPKRSCSLQDQHRRVRQPLSARGF